MDETSIDQNRHACRFWDATAGSGRNIHTKCGGKATGFLRIKHSGRLCPLCDACKETFVQAKDGMKDEVKKGFPGECEFSDVSLEDGRDEFLNQAPKKV